MYIYNLYSVFRFTAPSKSLLPSGIKKVYLNKKNKSDEN